MFVRVLGPLEVEEGDHRISIPAAKERTLLAALAIQANRLVAADTLIMALWGDIAPRTAPKTLQGYIKRLRHLLPRDAIVTRPHGYELRLDPDELDTTRFEQLLDSSRSAMTEGDTVTQRLRLSEALDLWRGRAYEEFCDQTFALREAARLEELRLSGIEDQIQADLNDGHHAAAVGRLESLVAEHPLRERLCCQLMTALYKCGRQADALHAFQRARATLAAELGIDPGPELRRVEKAILRHDHTLGGRVATPVLDQPVTRYARCGELHIAYQVFGEGPTDILVVNEWWSHCEVVWEYPATERFLRRLATFGRVILFDGRGTGLSDPVDHDEATTLEQWVDDGLAVLDAAGSVRTALLGLGAGSAMSILLAAAHPSRVSRLMVVDAIYDFQSTRAGALGFDETLRRIQANWGTGPGLPIAPSLADDPTFLSWFGRYQRMGVSPGQLAGRLRIAFLPDVRGIASTVQAPTLVLHRRGNLIVPIEHAHILASTIPDAELVELEGADHAWFGSDSGHLLDEVGSFLAKPAPHGPPERVLATVLVITNCGDSLDTAQYHALVSRQIDRYRGRRLGPSERGDVFVFDGPARAIRASVVVLDIARQLGLDASAGVHTGEVEPRNELASVAVDISAGVARLAPIGETWVSRTVVDLVVGSGIELTSRGDHQVPAAAATWELFAVRS